MDGVPVLRQTVQLNVNIEGALLMASRVAARSA
jgi:hypothetical protein